ncbi:O-succinylbenzoic acid--CoA ligase [Lysinibacillus composti]|uniref:2-succinylbenzoate--CoA ligase n=1 Tax=Lysinibacillus composti TaxID=720633 RepID=A0A3N9UL18_9BACI|nr:o-succinylbenzoate--CoA ligase [Lysinibacillus composti]MBM7606769.1 O-succinylbenzoic acid--CoA ligase [Lysinibacillus composti]RQW76617.1 o-succinylbenzoate--CoA ligase [Lysinibacillus composti]
MYPNWVLQRAKLTPSRIALTYEGISWTWEQMKTISLERAKQLSMFNIQDGNRIAILGPSQPRLIFMIYGCMHLRCEMVMLNRKLAKDELAYQIEDANVSLVLVDDEDINLLPEGTNYILFSTIENKNAKGQGVSISEEWALDQTITIMYTSGTTGFPKGVRQTVANHQANALSSVLNIGLSEKDTWLCAVPLFHISGFSILVRSLLYGNEVRLYRKFDPNQAVEDISAGNVTHMSVVAVTLERIIHGLEERGLKASEDFKVMLAGGGPVPKNYIERAHSLGLAVSQTYGMTETSSQTATLSNEDALRKLGSAGKPLFFNQIRIANASGPSEEGEILIKGPHVTPGYVGRFSNKNSTVNGWLHTGDIGYLDEEGYLYVVDRRSDLIISGGENIYPAEIENVLMGHSAIREAGVCGIEDETWGQVPIAFVVLKDYATKDDILSYCLNKLAKYKVPKEIYIVQTLPRNGSNKLMRRKLKELIETNN